MLLRQWSGRKDERLKQKKKVPDPPKLQVLSWKEVRPALSLPVFKKPFQNLIPHHVHLVISTSFAELHNLIKHISHCLKVSCTLTVMPMYLFIY